MADRYIIIPRLWYKMAPFHLLNETASLFLVHDGMQMLVDTSNDPEFPGFQGGEIKGAADWQEFGTINVSFKFS